ncbi:MAG: TonB-dependent receptor [Caulobacter sp.]|nr:TonB-dependent receptor [Caulobacter sp.]
MNLISRLAGGTALVALALASSTAVYAQETTSAVRGTITGDGGIPVAGATVTVVHMPSGTRSTTVTESNGTFDARGLRVGGPYEITVQASDFETRKVTGVFLTLADTARVDVDLNSVGTVEALTITASSKSDGETGPKTVLDRDAIEAVVSVNRDIRDLARRDILVTQNIRNDGGISIAGSNPRTNRITIDGVAAQDPYGLETGGLPTSRGPISLDAVDQFSIAAVPTDVSNGSFTGGAMNIVLRSGGNDFHGSLFLNYLNDGLVGRHLGTARVSQSISQKNYGAFLSGPIWRDKAFFALSYETYETFDNTLYGPSGAGFANAFANGLSQATIDQIVNTYNTGYASAFDLGTIARTAPVIDKKYSAKLDWNITDRQRLSVSYRRAESGFTSRTDLGSTTASLNSHWYDSTYLDEATTIELNSDWTDRLSTTVRATYRDWVKGQMPKSGQNYSDVTVCSAPTADAAPTNSTITTCASGFSSVRFGPDLNRHANQLDIQEAVFAGTATYSMGDHLFKVGYQGSKKEVFNVFVPNSRGTYYFDSIADFAAGRASSLTYNNSVTGNAFDAAANFNYWQHSVFAQDSLDVTSDVTVTAGFRYDWIKMDDVPNENPNFVARNGFSNTKTLDGLGIIMPRVSATWRVSDALKVNAGFGLFSGGQPEVLFATPFYNNGYQTASTTIRRCITAASNCTGANGYLEASTSSSVTPGFTAAVGSAALDALNTVSTFGYQIPTLVRNFQEGTLVGTPGINPTNEVIALSPTFQLPAEWKVYVSGAWEVYDGWRLDMQYVATQAKDAVTFIDVRAKPLIVNGVRALTPDGRLRYDGLSMTALQRTAQGVSSTNPGDNRDLIATNTDEGKSFTAGFMLSKAFDFGLDVGVGYARQNIDESNAGLRFGTTGSSLYDRVPAGLDPAIDAVGTGLEEIQDRYKLELGYRKNFFGDNETRITLFGERTSGRPYGFVMSDATSGRSPVFGVNRSYQLLYVPDIAGDTNTTDLQIGNVFFSDAANRDRFLGYVKTFGLAQGVNEKYSKRNKDLSRLDLQVSQEFPTLIDGHKLKLQFDVRNVLNLIDSDWGKVSEYFDGNVLTRVSCVDATGANLNAAVNGAICPAYKYSSVASSINKSTNTSQSLWTMQISLRYEF